MIILVNTLYPQITQDHQNQSETELLFFVIIRWFKIFTQGKIENQIWKNNDATSAYSYRVVEIMLTILLIGRKIMRAKFHTIFVSKK